jgi:hypothetical protein
VDLCPEDTRLALFQNTQNKLERFANRAAIPQKDELSSDKLIRRGAACFRPLLFFTFQALRANANHQDRFTVSLSRLSGKAGVGRESTPATSVWTHAPHWHIL